MPDIQVDFIAWPAEDFPFTAELVRPDGEVLWREYVPGPMVLRIPGFDDQTLRAQLRFPDGRVLQET